MKKLLNSKVFVAVALALGLYLVTTGISWAAFTFLVKTDGTTAPGVSLSELQKVRSRLSAELPKNQICPLNGQKYTDIEKNIWEKRAPMGIIIENHLDSRPQSGLSRADVVYEAVAEGGITRFLAMFYCASSSSDVDVAPVRSARVYFINWVSEYGETPLFVHFGGANNVCGNCPGGVKPRGTTAPEVQALEMLINLGWRYSSGNALDGGANVSYPAIKRDQYRLSEEPSAWEHSAVGSTDLLFDLGVERGFNGTNSGGELWSDDFDSWTFSDDKPVSSPTASKISFEFWSNKPDYDVSWEYDSSTNSYKRFNGGKPHTDWEFDKPQIMAKNVAIMFITERGPVDRELHMFYETVGEGSAMIFQNGDLIEGTWEKTSRTGRTKFYDEDGEEIPFVRGSIWIEAIPRGNDVLYE